MKKKYKIIAVLDTIEDKILQQSLEIIGFAESFLSGDLSEMLLIVPGKDVLKLCTSISEKYGVDAEAVENESFFYPNPELIAVILSQIIVEFNTEFVVFSQTVRNCQIAAKLSAAHGFSSITAVESFTYEKEGCIFQRSIFNGKLKENVLPIQSCAALTILSGAYSIPEKNIPFCKNAAVTQKKVNIDINGYKPVSLSAETDSGVKLEEADVIVSIGRGIGKEENLKLIRDTAGIFANSAVGASRPVCDNKWLPFNHQVGVTGKTVSPRLYMACGISGSQQHIAGMKNSNCIVAINKDSNASIFSISDYIIIEDIQTFLPVLVKKYNERNGN
jgi:electron transfer flavoprotein alpha subunit